MGRSFLLIVVLLSLAACTSAANAPAVDPTATTTPSAKDSSRSGCQTWDAVPAPNAAFTHGEQWQGDARVAVNWQSEDCAISSHPIATLPLPEFAVQVPLGASAQLTFSAKPDTVSGYAWRPDFSSAEEPSARKVEVPLDGLRGSTRIDLALEAVASQEVDLTSLPPGDYAIEVSAEWENGSSGFAFRVQILEP